MVCSLFHERPLCSNDFNDFRLGDCVTVVDSCGDLPANTTNLTVIGNNIDDECLVARVGNTTHGSCKAYQLTKESNETCGDVDFVVKLDEGELVLCLGLLLHAGLGIFLVGCYGGADSKIGQGLLFWWSDFFAGLSWNMIAAACLTSGIDDPVRSFVVSLACGLVFEEVFYDLPLKVFKTYAGTLCWICAVWILGCFYLLFGLNAAYSAETVALMGHHAILYGLVQWIADILKAVVKKHVSDFVCQRPQTDVYRVLITELGEPLPDVQRKEGESQENPGKV